MKPSITQVELDRLRAISARAAELRAEQEALETEVDDILGLDDEDSDDPPDLGVDTVSNFVMNGESVEDLLRSFEIRVEG